jgi:hypothetical protein
MYMEHVREISEPFMRAKMRGDAASAERWLNEDLQQVPTRSDSLLTT